MFLDHFHHKLSHQSVKEIIDKFEKTGSVHDRPHAQTIDSAPRQSFETHKNIFIYSQQ
jgi:hypothetical protein